ncbi:MAG: glycoside hydrolase family 2 TIM barrel-domain containing protein, partial [Kiritimatiellia bacterium]
KIALSGLDGKWSATLYDSQQRVVAKLTPDQPTRLLPGIAPWSAEHPTLYTLVITKGNDIRRKWVGFKSQSIQGNRLILNGKAVKLKGVNRHETSPEGGRTVTLDEMLRDASLMKRHNINTVRTSHYPNHHLWYDICDLYGIYLIAEANVEGHEAGCYQEEGLGAKPEWERSILERNLRHIRFYRNHPSVTIWSLGNETSHGDNFRKTLKAIREIDSSRPLHWEPGNVDADIDSHMYPSVEWLEARGRLGDGLASEMGSVIKHDRWTRGVRSQTRGKPFLMCEYAHAMGNALGNLEEYWQTIYRYDSLIGGCIWDWADQAIWKETDKLDSKTGKAERYLAYGGDFDESPNDGPFNCNGVVDAERHITPKLLEVAQVYRPLAVRKDGTGFILENRKAFTDASAYEGWWTLLRDGVPLASNRLEGISAPPLSQSRFRIPELDGLAKTNGELAVDFAFRTRTPTLWAPSGWVAARDQVGLQSHEKVATSATAKVAHARADNDFELRWKDSSLRVDGATGIAVSLCFGGREILAPKAGVLPAGPRLTCSRAFTDNDARIRGGVSNSSDPHERIGFYDSGLSQLRYHATDPERLADGLRLRIKVSGAKSAGWTHTITYRALASGGLRIENRIEATGTFPRFLPRLGLSLRLAPGLEQLRYYGRGPHENYIDRSTSAFLGLYETTVDAAGTDYVRPQENGCRCDVRWATLTDSDGRGVRFSGSRPLFLQALHCDWEDLEFARHRAGQMRFRAPVPRRDEVFLNLDILQLGLGGASCGPGPLPCYTFDPRQARDWHLTIEEVDR